MYLYGASGHAKVIIDILKSRHITITGLFDDNQDIKSLLEYPVLGRFSLDTLNNEELIVSIGINSIRKEVISKLPGQIKYGQAIYSESTISDYAWIGKGSVIMQGVTIQSCANIGNHCIINTNASIDHDCIIEDFVHIAPNACLCGSIKVGEGSQVGAGAVVIPGIKIGKWSLIGAGSVVIHHVPDNVIIAGNPAKVIRKI